MFSCKSPIPRILIIAFAGLVLTSCGGKSAAEKLADQETSDSQKEPATPTAIPAKTNKNQPKDADIADEKAKTGELSSTAKDAALPVEPSNKTVLTSPVPASPIAPAAPLIKTPSGPSYLSNTPSLVISGECASGTNVIIAGDLVSGDMASPPGELQTACASGSFSFTVSKNASGTYEFELIAKDIANGLSSSSASIRWNLDTIAPDEPVFQIPASSPFASGSGTLSLAGSCETGATVLLSGTSVQQLVCSSSQYAFQVSKAVDGVYDFQVQQTDPAGNASGPVSLRWILDTTTPVAPVISLPTKATVSTNMSSLQFSGSCQNNALVKIAGDVTAGEMLAPVGALSLSCTSSSYSFIVAKGTDGTYNLSVSQTNPNNGQVSPAVAVLWIRDTQAPADLLLSSPASNPHSSTGSQLSLAGNCETGTQVSLVGASSDSTGCSHGSFSFTVQATVDGSYNYILKQTDAAGNVSPQLSFVWTRYTPVPPAAPTITTPSASPYLSKGPNLTIAGQCTTGTNVIIAGDVVASDMVVPGGQLQLACSSGSYSFTLTKASSGYYGFHVHAVDPATNLSSSSVQTTWEMDTTAPPDPVLQNPVGNPYTSGSGTLNLVGECKAGALVALSGASDQEVSCSSGQYSFLISKSMDGTYDFYIQQTDIYGNASGVVAQRWILDSTVPPTIVMTQPTGSTVLNASSSIQLMGNCQNNAVVQIEGDVAASEMLTPEGQLSLVCSSSQFRFVVSKVSDGMYDLKLSQKNPNNGYSSAVTSVKWTRDTQAPAAGTLTSPASNPYYSGGSQVSISGSCETGAIVNLSGAATGSLTCSSGTYSFMLSNSVDGTYSYSIKQTDGAGNISPALGFTWTRDTSIPAAPSITSPAASSIVSNSSSFTVAGACTNGYTVTLGGDVSASEVTVPSQSRTLSCTNNSYSFSFSKFSDNTYSITVDQTNPVNSSRSAKASISWQRDTIAPNRPLITAPKANPLTSGDTNLTMQGTCETGAVVYLTGASTASQSCASGAFSFSVTRTEDNVYNFSLYQVDAALNTSTATGFQWIRDTSIPPTPGIAVPASNLSTSNTSSLTISGSCVSTYTVTLGGHVVSSDVTSPSNSLTQTCSGSSYSYTVKKTVDGVYDLTIIQTSASLQDSAQVVQRWVRDTVAPAAPSRMQPAANPYKSSGVMTISGGCETGATVYLAGAFNQSINCSAGTYSFTVSATSDGTYNLSVHQVDAAGNSSNSFSQTWIKDSTTPPTPTISSPKINPYTSNSSVFALGGGCQPGYEIILGGDVVASAVMDPVGSLTQMCPTSGSYSYSIAKTVDGTYTFTVKAANGSLDSGLAEQTWIRDTVAPVISWLKTPPHPNLQLASSIEFSADDANAIIECKLDNGSYSGCSSPVRYNNLSNGAHSFSVRGTDSAGNVGTVTTINWSQEAYNTIALYRFTAGSEMIDSGLYSGIEHNDLSQSGTTSDTGLSWSGESRRFNASSNSFCSSPDNNSQDLVTDMMTLEAYVKFYSLTTNTALITKSGVSGNYGWEWKIRKQGNNFVQTFAVSVNGTTITEVKSSSFYFTTGSSSAYRHLAVTFDKGTVKFFVDGAARGSSTIGTAGSTISFASTAPLRLGISQGSVNALDGSMDEVRISQNIRWTGAFTKPSAPHVAD